MPFCMILSKLLAMFATTGWNALSSPYVHKMTHLEARGQPKCHSVAIGIISNQLNIRLVPIESLADGFGDHRTVVVAIGEIHLLATEQNVLNTQPVHAPIRFRLTLRRLSCHCDASLKRGGAKN